MGLRTSVQISMSQNDHREVETAPRGRCTSVDEEHGAQDFQLAYELPDMISIQTLQMAAANDILLNMLLFDNNSGKRQYGRNALSHAINRPVK